MSVTERQLIEFQISMNSFRDEVMGKHMIMDRIEKEFQTKIRSRISHTQQYTSQVIKFCRKNIEEIERTLLDIKSYFIDLKLQFVHELFVTIFKIMIICYKALSQRFAELLNEKKKEKMEIKDNEFNKNTEKLLQIFRNKNYTELEYIDSIIQYIENDEKNLTERKRYMEQNFVLEKEKVEGINVSDSVSQLENLKVQFDRIVLMSQRLNQDENVKRNELILKNSLKKSEEIEEQFYFNIADSTRDIFFKKMVDIAKKFYINIRENEKQVIIQQIEKQKPPTKSIETQTVEQQPKNENSKDKNILLFENQHLRKANIAYKKQLIQCACEKEKMLREHKELEKKNKITQELLNKKANEMEKIKADYEFNLNKKDSTIQQLNRRISTLNKEKNEISQRKALQIKQLQQVQKSSFEQLEKDQFSKTQFLMTNSKIKNNLSKTQTNVGFVQRESKIHKKENNQLRKSLILMLDTLQEQKLIMEYPIMDLNKDLRLGKLIDKIQAISTGLLTKVKEIKTKEIKESKPKQARTSQVHDQTKRIKSITPMSDFGVQPKEKKFKIQHVDYGVQTNIQNLRSKVQNSVPNNNFILKSQKSERNQENKLQALKKQLMSRVYLGLNNRRSAINRKSRLHIHELDASKVLTNNSMENWKNVEEENKENKKQSTKASFNRKDISFEQFKFNTTENKTNIHNERKLFYHQTKKSQDNLRKEVTKKAVNINNKSYGNDQIEEILEQKVEQASEELIFGVNSYQRMNQLKTLMHTIQGLCDRNQKKMKRLLKKLVDEIKKTKGKNFIYELMKDQRAQTLVDNKISSRTSLFQ